MKLLFFLCFICAIQSTLSRFKNVHPEYFKLGLVRYTATSRIKCAGIFITPNILLTTAKCINYGNLHLMVTLYDYTKGHSVHYKVKAFKYNETFELKPYKDNIGLIQINGRVPDDAIAALPEEEQNHPALDSHYIYALKNHRHRYIFEINKVKVYTNAACSFALKKYIPTIELCTYKDTPYDGSEVHQGSTLLYRKDNITYIAGIYVEQNVKIYNGVKIIRYEDIYPQVDWIIRNADIPRSKTKCHMN